MRKLLKLSLSYLVILCLFCYSGCIVNAQSDTDVDKADISNGMVYAENTNFYINGQPFYYAGANSYDLFTLGDGYIGYTDENRIENNFMDKNAIDKRMENMQKDGIKVVRTWGFSHEQWHGFEPEKGVYNESEFKEFDYILDSARRHNI